MAVLACGFNRSLLHLQHPPLFSESFGVASTGRNRRGADAGPIVDAALMEMMSPTTSDIGNSTLDALLSSGRIEILTNTTLRAKLAAWGGVIGEVWDDQDSHAKIIYEVQIPYFINNNLSVGISMRELYDEWPIPGKSVSEDADAMKRLLQDPKFRVLAEIRYGYKKHLTQEFKAAIAAAESILAEIGRSIDVSK